MEFGVVASLFVKHTGLSPDRTFCVFVWGLMTKPTRWRLFFLFLFFFGVTHPVTWTQSTLPLLPPPSSLHVNIRVVDGMMQWVKVPCLLFFVFYVLQCFAFWDRGDWRVSLYAKWLNFHSSLSLPLGLCLKKNAPPFLSLKFSSFSFKPSSGLTFQLSF